MISFRFHVVSITAVFLAIAIGVVVGSTYVDGAIVDGLREPDRHGRGATSTSARDENDRLEARARATRGDYIDAERRVRGHRPARRRPGAPRRRRGASTRTRWSSRRCWRARPAASCPGSCGSSRAWGLESDDDRAALADDRRRRRRTTPSRTSGRRRGTAIVDGAHRARRPRRPAADDRRGCRRAVGLLADARGRPGSSGRRARRRHRRAWPTSPAPAPRVLVITGARAEAEVAPDGPDRWSTAPRRRRPASTVVADVYVDGARGAGAGRDALDSAAPRTLREVDRRSSTTPTGRRAGWPRCSRSTPRPTASSAATTATATAPTACCRLGRRRDRRRRTAPPPA